METYIPAILSFIAGGGLSTIVSARYIRKVSKIDAAQKIVDFYESTAKDLLKRIEDLENEITKLKPIRCTRHGCRLRINEPEQK